MGCKVINVIIIIFFYMIEEVAVFLRSGGVW